MNSPPSLREMLDTLAEVKQVDPGNVFQVYSEVVEDLGPETALYQGLVEIGVMEDPDVELAKIANEPIRLSQSDLDEINQPEGEPDADGPTG